MVMDDWRRWSSHGKSDSDGKGFIHCRIASEYDPRSRDKHLQMVFDVLLKYSVLLEPSFILIQTNNQTLLKLLTSNRKILVPGNVLTGTRTPAGDRIFFP